MQIIGGIGIAVDGDYPVVATAPSAETPDVVLRLRAERTAPPFFAGTPAIERDSWLAAVDGGTFTLCAKDRHVAAARIELPRDGLKGRYLWDDPAPYLFGYPMAQLLVIHALGVAGGALMHGAAICGKDGALLCCGPSGTGKTTMSRAAAALGARVLSDERTIVRPARDGGWLLGGTPWPGEGGFADNASVPLRGLILLEQGARNEVVPLSPARALALLYRCHFPPLWDPAAAERTLGHLERLVRELPAVLFRNVKGADAARILLDRVGGVA